MGRFGRKSVKKTCIFANYSTRGQKIMTMYSEKTYIWRTLLVALLLIFCGTISAQKKVAVRNNFVYDISGTLNMGVD